MNRRIPSGTVLVLLVGLVVTAVGVWLAVDTARNGGTVGGMLTVLLPFVVTNGALIVGARWASRQDAARRR